MPLASIRVGGDPTDTVVLPHGRYVVVGSELSDQVAVVDVALRAVTLHVACGRSPYMLAAAPDGSSVVVLSQYDGTLSVIETDDFAVAATVRDVGGSPGRVCFAPDGGRCYVTDQNGGRLTVVKTSDWSVDARAPAGRVPRDVAVLPDGSAIFTANIGETDLIRLRGSDLSLEGSVKLGFRPHRLRVLGCGRLLAVAEYHGSRLAVVSVQDGVVVRSIDLGSYVGGMCTTNQDAYLFVTCEHEAGAVGIVRIADWQLIGFVQTGLGPQSVAAPSDGAFVVSADRIAKTVTLIGGLPASC